MRSREILRGLASIMLMTGLKVASEQPASAQETAQEITYQTCGVKRDHLILDEAGKPIVFLIAEEGPAVATEATGKPSEAVQKQVILSCHTVAGPIDIEFTVAEYLSPLVYQQTAASWQEKTYPSFVITNYTDTIIHNGQEHQVSFGQTTDSAGNEVINSNSHVNCHAYVLHELGKLGLIPGMQHVVTNRHWERGAMLYTLAQLWMSETYNGTVENLALTNLQPNDILFIYAKGNPIPVHSAIFRGFNPAGEPVFEGKLGTEPLITSNLHDIYTHFQKYFGATSIGIFRADTPIRLTDELEG